MSIKNNLGKEEVFKKVSKENIVLENSHYENTMCLLTFNKLFKGNKTFGSDFEQRFEVNDLLEILYNSSIFEKEENLRRAIGELADEQVNSEGIKAEQFVKYIREKLIVYDEDDYSLRNMFDDIKDPKTGTVTFDTVKHLRSLIKEDKKYSDEKLKLMINKSSKSGTELDYEDFKKLFQSELF